MFYPRLFEKVEDLSSVDAKTLKTYVGKSSSTVKSDIIDNQVLKVDNKKRSDKLELEEIINSRGKYKQNLIDFLENKGYDVEQNIENYTYNKKEEKKNNPSSMKPVFPINLTYGQFWDYQVDKLLNEYENDEKEKTNKEESKINFDDKVSEFEISPNLLSYYESKGKLDKFKEWIKNIPSKTKITSDLIRFFRLLDDIVSNENKRNIKISGVISIRGLKIKELDAEAQERWKTDMIEHIGNYSTPEELNDVYEDQILTHGEFLNALFMIDTQGVGRGELLMTFCIPDSKFPGGGESYDLKISNRENKDILEVNGTTYEIKDYSNVEKSGKGAMDSIRLGTGGKLTRFEFWKNIEKTISTVKKIDNELSDQQKNELFDPYLQRIWNFMVTETGPDSIPGGVKSGELSNKKIHIINSFYYFMHELIKREMSDEIDDKYSIASLRGRSGEDQSVLISPISAKDIESGKTIEVQQGKEIQKALFELSLLEYVKNPTNFYEDMNKVAEEYFKHNPDIDYFLVFRPDKINIVGASDFAFATITQAAVKIIEKEYAKPDMRAKRAHERWKEAVSMQEKNANPEEKESYENIKKEITYKDFYKEELINESFYPRLI